MLRIGHLTSVIAVFGIALTGCLNNVASKTGSSSTITTPGTTTTTTQTTAFAIEKVIRNSQDPGSTLDVIGDNTNMIGTYCVSADGSGSTSGATTCKCVFSYTNPTSGIAETVEADTTYHESNLLRCKYTASNIPAAVQTMQVSVRSSTLGQDSNSITFSFFGNGSSLDTSNPETFAEVIRYACRDVVDVPNLFDSTVYDPVQSEDPTITYPIHFYTSNLGKTLASYALKGNKKWDCPANPKNPPAKYQVTLYSAQALGGSKVISPPATRGVNDRSTFFLAKEKTGVFNVPINAYFAPLLRTAENTEFPPLGYGASPIASGTAGVESCPDSSVSIPSGYHWVKVWQYRMALSQRKYVSSYKFQQLGDVACNPSPTQWTVATPYTLKATNWVFPDCAGSGSGTGDMKSLTAGDFSALGLASRFFLGTGMCVLPTPGGAGAGYKTGSDSWVNNAQATAAPTTDSLYDLTYNCRGTGKIDPTDLCTANTPHDDDVAVGLIDSASASRFEFLFVVTPKTVNSGDMGSTTSTEHFIYTPYRFRVAADCASNDPDTAGCDFTKAMRNYGIKWHDVNSAGDPPADNPSRAGVFPVCALQPDS